MELENYVNTAASILARANPDEIDSDDDAKSTKSEEAFLDADGSDGDSLPNLDDSDMPPPLEGDEDDPGASTKQVPSQQKPSYDDVDDDEPPPFVEPSADPADDDAPPPFDDEDDIPPLADDAPAVN